MSNPLQANNHFQANTSLQANKGVLKQKCESETSNQLKTKDWARKNIKWEKDIKAQIFL